MSGTAVALPDIEQADAASPSGTVTGLDGATRPEHERGLALPVFDDDGVLIEVVYVDGDEVE